MSTLPETDRVERPVSHPGESGVRCCSMAFLYADTGGGHRASASAVKQAVEHGYGDAVHVVMIDPTKRNRSALIRTSDRLYSRCIRSAPWIWAVVFHATNRRWVTWVLRRTMLRSLGASASAVAGDANFDVVVSFHPLLSHAARDVADRVDARAVTVMTDLLEPHASWAHRGMDAVFVPNGSSAAAMVRHGVAAERCHCVGLPVGAQFTEPNASTDGAGAAPDGRFRVLLVGGGEGAGGLYRKARLLLRTCPGVEVQVITGRNTRLLERLTRLETRHRGWLRAVGFVDDMATWMRSADLVVTKAGPGTIAEALAVGTPLLITGHLRGQERRNPEFVTIGRAGLRARRPRQLVSRVRELAAAPERLEQHRWATRLLSRPQAASDIADHLVKLAQVGDPTGRLHRLHALSPSDGSNRPGRRSWALSTEDTLKSGWPSRIREPECVAIVVSMPVTVEPTAVVVRSSLTSGRVPLWSQAITIAWLYWLYDAINDMSPRRTAVAMAHARTLLRLESKLHLDMEQATNVWVAAHRVIALGLADFYDLAHLGVTFVVLVAAWWHASPSFPTERNTLVLVNVIGFICFVAYPVAPPRMLPSFIDVVSLTHAIGSWHSGALGAHANEFAAMPSLHVAWAVWCAWTVRAWAVRLDTTKTPKPHLVRRRVWEMVAIAYLVMTVVAVVVTANHFVLDVVGGALTFAAAATLGRVVSTRRSA